MLAAPRRRSSLGSSQGHWEPLPLPPAPIVGRHGLSARPRTPGPGSQGLQELIDAQGCADGLRARAGRPRHPTCWGGPPSTMRHLQWKTSHSRFRSRVCSTLYCSSLSLLTRSFWHSCADEMLLLARMWCGTAPRRASMIVNQCCISPVKLAFEYAWVDSPPRCCLLHRGLRSSLWRRRGSSQSSAKPTQSGPSDSHPSRAGSGGSGSGSGSASLDAPTASATAATTLSAMAATAAAASALVAAAAVATHGGGKLLVGARPADGGLPFERTGVAAPFDHALMVRRRKSALGVATATSSERGQRAPELASQKHLTFAPTFPPPVPPAGARSSPPCTTTWFRGCATYATTASGRTSRCDGGRHALMVEAARCASRRGPGGCDARGCSLAEACFAGGGSAAAAAPAKRDEAGSNRASPLLSGTHRPPASLYPCVRVSARAVRAGVRDAPPSGPE